MSQRNLALIITTVGIIIYFLPIVQQVADGIQHQLIGALFAIGGLIIYYMPKGTSKKK